MNILDKYRDSCLLYIKIDFGLLAVFGTAISLFKLERKEIIELFIQYEYLLIAVVILLIFSLLLERSIVLGMKSEESQIPEKVFKNFKLFLQIQLILHVGFFG